MITSETKTATAPNSILEKYLREKKELIQVLKNLKKEGIIPLHFKGKKYDEQTVEKLINDFDKEEFTISVCGQIKAGKSSFLNHLLFQDKTILPADDTPWTAKLTTIRYGSKDEAQVTFYSQKDWNEIKEQELKDPDTGEINTYYEMFLKADVDQSALKGIFETEYIHTEKKITRNVPLANLREYVAKGGKFTPFVNQVDISVNNEMAKGVTFVDTPGINDQNVFRSRVTEDWINKSSAVIYLFYTGQALAKADYDFIDIHLRSIPSSTLLFVLTKADTSNDYEGAQKHVEYAMREDKELKARNFLPDSKKVYPISTLCSVLDYKLKNDLTLNEDEQFHLNRIQRKCPNLLEEKGRIPEMVEAIQTHLMKDKGTYILNKYRETVKDIFQTKIDFFKSEINALDQKLGGIEGSATELKIKKEKHEKTINSIESIKNVYIPKTARLQTELENIITIELNKLARGTSKNTLVECHESYKENSSINNYRNIAGAKIKRNIELTLERINEKIESLDLSGKVKSFEEKFLSEIRGLLDKELENKLDFAIVEPLSIHNSLSQLRLDKMEPKNLEKTCGKYWWLKQNKKDVVSKINNEINKVIKSYFENHIAEPLHGHIWNKVDHFVRQTSENITYELDKLLEDIEDIQANSTEKEIQLKEVKTKLKISLEKKEETEKKYSQINHFLNY